MYDDPQSNIAKAKSRIEQLRELQQRFVAHIEAHSDAKDVCTRLQVEGDDLIVDMLGFRAIAKPRVVTDNSDYHLEYVFFVTEGEDQIETARFYLGAGGRFSNDLSANSYLFDFDNIYAARQICTTIGLGILSSKLFEPRKKSQKNGLWS